MKIALLGYGYWGKIVRGYIDNEDFFELVKIYDPRTTLEGLFTNNLEEILNDNTIGAVYIASPVDTHFELITRAIQHNKYVLCEKPIVGSPKEFEMLKKLLPYKNFIETNYIYTDSFSIQKIKEKIEKMSISKIKYIEANIKQLGNFYSDADVYSVLGSHLLSVIFYLFDYEIFSVRYIDKIFHNKQVVSGTILLSNDDINCELNVSLWDLKKERTVKVFCDNEIMVFDMQSENSLLIQKFEIKDNVLIKEDIIRFNYDEGNNLKIKK